MTNDKENFAIIDSSFELRIFKAAPKNQIAIERTFSDNRYVYNAKKTLTARDQTILLALLKLYAHAKASDNTECGDNPFCIKLNFEKIRQAGNLKANNQSIKQSLINLSSVEITSYVDGLQAGKLIEIFEYQPDSENDDSVHEFHNIVNRNELDAIEDAHIEIDIHHLLHEVINNKLKTGLSDDESFGNHYFVINIDERAKLKSDLAKLAHAWFSSTVKINSTSTPFFIKTLTEHLIDCTIRDDKAVIAKQDVARVKSALNELSSLEGWSIIELEKNKYRVKRFDGVIQY
jgi:hypothetical protein